MPCSIEEKEPQSQMAVVGQSIGNFAARPSARSTDGLVTIAMRNASLTVQQMNMGGGLGKPHSNPTLRISIDYFAGLTVPTVPAKSLILLKNQIWMQQVSGGDPVQITKRPGHNWQPDWSPNGAYIAYRSEGGGGLFVAPALGGVERRITSFCYNPRAAALSPAM
jgi:WD40-like Beta Propeller Repeat